MSTASEPFDANSYREILPFVTSERLGSYFRASDGDLIGTFALYEWNMRVAASVMELTSMVEVVARNALDTELRGWAQRRSGGASWLDAAPLDRHGAGDIARARERATGRGRRPEAHGRVIAELSLGFWRYLVGSRYLTSLWVPATHRAFPHGDTDLRDRQRAVEFRLQQLHFVRNRAAHHEPLHHRDLGRDLALAIELVTWVSPAAGRWVEMTTSLPAVLLQRPGAGVR